MEFMSSSRHPPSGNWRPNEPPSQRTHTNRFGGMDTEPGSYAVIVRMGYRDLRFDIPMLVDEDTVYEIVRRKMGAPPAAREAVESLTRRRACEISLEDSHVCVVCLEAYEAEDEVTTMPCQHMFHSECLLPWLKQHNTCPICRTSVPAEPDADKKFLLDEVSTNSNRETAAQSSPDSNSDMQEHESVLMLSDNDIREMRARVPVRQLRMLITTAGGQCEDCIEKEELFMRYLVCLDRIRATRESQK